MILTILNFEIGQFTLVDIHNYKTILMSVNFLCFPSTKQRKQNVSIS